MTYFPSIRWFVLTALAGSLFAFAVQCVSTPVTRRMSLQLIPEQQMNALGEQAYADLRSRSAKSQSPELRAALEKVGRRIAVASGKNYAWEFELIDDPNTVNAMCLPGGKIAFYTGILPIAQNEAGLAAVMGHEVAHAVAGHGNERMSQSLIVQMGLAAAEISLRDNRQRGLIYGALALGVQFGVLLPYSRTHETEADIIGLRYMAEAGYPPSEAVAFWERMNEAGEGRIPEFMSTHPSPKSRVAKLNEAIPSVMSVYQQSKKQLPAPLPLK
jgi:predicted Zn-dependent protease